MSQLEGFLREPSSILIDLSTPHHFGASAMVPLIALVDSLSSKGWQIDVAPPDDPLLLTYWESTGWLQAIEGIPLPDIRSRKTYTPIIHFADHHVLNHAVSAAIDILSMTTEYPSGVLNAVEWTLNEIADNVLVHSTSSGWLQVISRPKQHAIDMVISDTGVGIPGSMRQGYPQVQFDSELIELAVQRGTTRDASIGQGNGLAGSLRLSEALEGYGNIISGSAAFRQTPDGNTNVQAIVSYPGTTVNFSLQTQHSIDLSEALWGYSPAKTFEFSHLAQTGILFLLSAEYSAFGNRASGADLALKLRNIMNDNPNETVIIDFSGVDLTSASFLDEFLAKVIRREGIVTFFNRVQLINTNDFVKRTLDEVVAQRIQTG